jgi:hypothetical protein
VASLSGYDRERGKRYKRWWSRQKGAPQGELISVPEEAWQHRDAVVPEQRKAIGGGAAGDSH